MLELEANLAAVRARAALDELADHASQDQAVDLADGEEWHRTREDGLGYADEANVGGDAEAIDDAGLTLEAGRD